ncbi:uncharacterized protein ACWYII_021962 [Salvelinus alpinus]
MGLSLVGAQHALGTSSGFRRVRDRRQVDSDSDSKEETTVLDEVQLDVPLDDLPDVPQLPDLLDVQNAAIILEDVPDVQTILEEATGNWQLIPIRCSPLYCGPVVIRNNAGPVVKAWRTFQFISPIITYMRGGSQQVVVRMHHVSRVRGLETQLVWAISKETARLNPEGIHYCATKVQSITWIQTLLGSTLSRNHLFVAGKVLLGALVQANHMDEAKFLRTYTDFVDYLSDPSKRNDIERELAEAKIHHVNMIDVLFELVLFGLMTAQKSLMVHPGGFVERLYALLYSFLPTAANMEPEADRYLLLLNDSCDTLPPNRDLDTNALHYFALNLTFLNKTSCSSKTFWFPSFHLFDFMTISSS